jgi:hypothetical protein
MDSARDTILGILTIGVAVAVGAILHSVYVSEPPPVAPAQGYVIRRGEFTIVDKRKNPDATINPSYMVPNMRYICTEDRK